MLLFSREFDTPWSGISGSDLVVSLHLDDRLCVCSSTWSSMCDLCVFVRRASGTVIYHELLCVLKSGEAREYGPWETLRACVQCVSRAFWSPPKQGRISQHAARNWASAWSACACGIHMFRVLGCMSQFVDLVRHRNTYSSTCTCTKLTRAERHIFRPMRRAAAHRDVMFATLRMWTGLGAHWLFFLPHTQAGKRDWRHLHPHGPWPHPKNERFRLAFQQRRSRNFFLISPLRVSSKRRHPPATKGLVALFWCAAALTQKPGSVVNLRTSMRILSCKWSLGTRSRPPETLWGPSTELPLLENTVERVTEKKRIRYAKNILCCSQSSQISQMHHINGLIFPPTVCQPSRIECKKKFGKKFDRPQCISPSLSHKSLKLAFFGHQSQPCRPMIPTRYSLCRLTFWCIYVLRVCRIVIYQNHAQRLCSLVAD